MDGLATAGLYTRVQMVPNGGGFTRRVTLYTPTAELEKWRRGARLCVAKSWAVGRAPWLEKVPEVTTRLRGVRQIDSELTVESQNAFEIRDRRWVALSTTELRQLPRAELAEKERRGGGAGGVFEGLKKLLDGSSIASLTVGQSNTPSESAAREFYEQENSKPIAAGILKVESFKKTNATKHTDEGVEMYALEYQAELVFPSGNMPDCVDDTHFNPQCFMAQLQGIRFLKVGARITDSGTIVFEKAENGWRAKQLKSNR